MAEIKIAYLCDRKACENCCYPMCKRTTDISHAVNFRKTEIADKNCGGVVIEERYVEREAGEDE